MTVILVHATADHAFVAADSVRWDHVQRRNVGPVMKVHVAGESAALAMGGSNIDRSALAKELVSSRLRGETFPETARRVTPCLFQAARDKMNKLSVTGPQFVISWYLEAGEDECKVHRHHLPEDCLSEVQGFECMGPDTGWLTELAGASIEKFFDAGRLRLDEWAYHVIDLASKEHPAFVGLPATAAILRPGGQKCIRYDLRPEEWSGPQEAFSVPMTLGSTA